MTFNIQSRLPSAQFNLESIPDADRLNIALSALLELSLIRTINTRGKSLYLPKIKELVDQ